MNAFESEVAASCQHLGIFYQKVPVACKLGWRGPRPALVPLGENPYDSYMVHEGRHIALELKSQELFGRFDLCRIEPNQRAGLDAMLAHGADAWLLFNMRRAVREVKTPAGVVDREVAANRAWAMHWCHWEALLTHVVAGRKSIPATGFASALMRPLPRLRLPNAAGERACVWDMRALLHRVNY